MSIGTDELVLRPHQEFGIAGVRELMRDGNKRVILVGPAGSGKRYQAVYLSRQAAQKDKRCLVVTNRITLVKQMYDELRRFGIEYGVIMGDVPQNREALVQVASLQTLQSRYLYNEGGGGLPPADLVVVDECHNNLDAYMKLFSFYPDAKIIGLTATPVGPSGASLMPIYEKMFIGSKESELISKGLLLPTKVFCPSEPNLEGVKINGRDYSQKEVNRRVLDVTTFANVFEFWKPYCWMKTICFIPGVAFSRGITEQFIIEGFQAAHIDAKTPIKQREDLFEELANGHLRVICSVDVLREGFDVPRVQCGIDLQPTLQLRNMKQKCGRVRRPFEDQEDCIWIDMNGSYWRHGHPDTDFPWEQIHGKETTRTLQKKPREPGDPKPIQCPKCSFARTGGNVCPNCGHESTQSIRRVRMGNGKIKEMPVPGSDDRHDKKLEKSIAQKKWDKALGTAVYANMTVAQAKHLYHTDTGDWPPDNLDYMPKQNSGDWQRKAKDVYPWKDRRKNKEPKPVEAEAE